MRLEAFVLAAALVGCGGEYVPVDPPAGGGGGGGGGAGNPGEMDPAPNGGGDVDDLAFCVSEINRYRATVGLPPYQRSDELDAFSAEAARVDGTAHDAHRHFTQTNGGGIAFAENEIPWWPLEGSGTVRAVIAEGLELMWSEGPGGGHHDAMAGDYTEVGCGVYVGSGEVTSTQDFR